MSIAESGKGYILDPLYQKEGLEFGATMAFSPGAHLAGFSDPNDPEQIAKFAGYRRPDGTPMLRKRGDRERTLQIQIGSVCREFNAKLATASPGEFLTAAHCAVQAAIEADREVLEPRIRARVVSGGKKKVEALLLAHYTAHGTSRSGDVMLHVHCAGSRPAGPKAARSTAWPITDCPIGNSGSGTGNSSSASPTRWRISWAGRWR